MDARNALQSFDTSLRPDLNPLDPHPPSHVEFCKLHFACGYVSVGLAVEKALKDSSVVALKFLDWRTGIESRRTS